MLFLIWRADVWQNCKSMIAPDNMAQMMVAFGGVVEAVVLSGRAEITMMLKVFGVRRTNVIEIFSCFACLSLIIMMWSLDLLLF